MKSLILATLLIISIFCSVNQEKQYPYTNFSFNETGLLRLHFKNVSDTSNYTLFYNIHLPEYQIVERFMIYSDSLIEFEIKTVQPTIIYFCENGNTQLMIVPKDTLDVIIDSKQDLPFTERLNFKGKNAIISDYYSKAKLFLFNNFPNKDESPENYNSRIDSTCILALKKLEYFNNKAMLPDWFIEFEKTDIIFHCEKLKLMQYNQRYWKYNQFLENKTAQTPKIKEKVLKINWMTDNINDYLCSIRPNKDDTLLMPQHFTIDIYFEYVRDNINLLKGSLSNKMVSYYVASKLSAIIQVGIYRGKSNLNFNDRCKKVDSLFNELAPLITDTAILKLITDYKIKEYANYLKKKELKKGVNAPAFFLEDINGSKVALTDFKGKLICLNFWGTYCAPCIESISQKNELVKKYGKSNFVLINILVDNNFKKWRELINKHNFEGIHLKCKGNWDKLLKESYLRRGVPHYTLIDKEGKILINDVNRDSLDFYIKANL